MARGDVLAHDVLGRLARPALELAQLDRAGMADRAEPIRRAEQDRVLESLPAIGGEDLEDRLGLHQPRPRLVVEVRRAARLGQLDRRHLDRLALAAGPPVDRVAGDARRLLRQVEGAHGGHAASLRLGVEGDPGVQVHQRSGRILDRQLAELDRLGEDDLLLGGEERDLADLLEVHANRVIDADEVGGERLEVLLALLGLGGGLGGGGRGAAGSSSSSSGSPMRVGWFASSRTSMPASSAAA